MRNVNLEENELTITAIFQQHTKEETIQTLKEMIKSIFLFFLKQTIDCIYIKFSATM